MKLQAVKCFFGVIFSRLFRRDFMVIDGNFKKCPDWTHLSILQHFLHVSLLTVFVNVKLYTMRQNLSSHCIWDHRDLVYTLFLNFNFYSFSLLFTFIFEWIFSDEEVVLYVIYRVKSTTHVLQQKSKDLMLFFYLRPQTFTTHNTQQFIKCFLSIS